MDRDDHRDVTELLKKAAERVVQSGIRLDAVYLYGSFASGNSTGESDIDVAFISDDFHAGSMEQWKMIMRICRQIDLRIEPVLYRPEEFRDEEPPTWQIKKEGVQIPLH
ncbi:MAG: nucleotidyltransferase domain-containing protein [Deferrisomatales bacterium]|nr:nucleotidyltransferase domain-containing protein [Deferrisomatales bacterium]